MTPADIEKAAADMRKVIPSVVALIEQQERRATVERIRTAVNACEEADDVPRLYPKVLDILDEEAAR